MTVECYTCTAQWEEDPNTETPAHQIDGHYFCSEECAHEYDPLYSEKILAQFSKYFI